jgi:AcrR family transcriptional regulator
VATAGRKRGPYTLRRRAERETETRLAITKATVALHQELGPLGTTVAAVAARAGVSRPTVYAHFPDDHALLAACTAHYRALHPGPDPAAWAEIADRLARLRVALPAIYDHWADVEPMATSVLRDHRADPVRAVGAGFERFAATCRQALVTGWSARGRRRKLIEAAVGHAIAFETWRSLVRDEGLSQKEAVELMMAAVTAAWRGRRLGPAAG